MGHISAVDGPDISMSFFFFFLTYRLKPFFRDRFSQQPNWEKKIKDQRERTNPCISSSFKEFGHLLSGHPVGESSRFLGLKNG